ncbi:MAG: dipeptide/oligopeptide/nickel ABC transporter ATP-binding protein [Chloroflexota bacterium]
MTPPTIRKAAWATALEVTDLVVSYPLAIGRFNAVDHVSLSVRPGERFGLVGESGSGKTTLAMAILRLLRPPAAIDRGRVLLGETDVLALTYRELRQVRWRRMSLIPQGAMNSLNPVMRVEDQVADAILAHEGRVASRGLKDRIAELLGSVGLPAKVARLYPHELSGGMKQRVCIAMAVALRPELIIADEPTSALDVVVQRIVAQTLIGVQQRLNASLILIGHDLGLQAQVVDRLGVMYRGRIVELGSVHSIFKGPVHPYTRMLIGSVPSIRSAPRSMNAGARQPADAASFEQCGLGGACPTPNDVGAERPAMHEVAPGHLVACRTLPEAV